MQLAKPVRPDTAAVDLATCVYLDLETTGLEPAAEVVALGIVDAEGAVLLDTLVRPQRLRAWPRAEYIHGISPADVARAPTWPELAPAIQKAVQDRHVVIYNAAFDCRFLGPLLDPSAEIHCCMVAWAEEIGEWSDYGGGYRWHKLVEAAAQVEFDWSRESPAAGPHSAIPDAQACRAVWQYLHDPELRAGLAALQAWRAQEEEAVWQGRLRELRVSARLERFIDYWWLGRRRPAHWAAWRPDPDNDLAVVFTGTTLRGLELRATYAHCFRRRSEIPAHLKPAGWFHPARWYQRELQATSALVGRRQAYALFPVSEKARLDVKFRLRLVSVTDTPTEVLATRTELQQMGYRPRQIAALTPVAERYNPVAHFWYPVYRVPDLEPALSRVGPAKQDPELPGTFDILR